MKTHKTKSWFLICPCFFLAISVLGCRTPSTLFKRKVDASPNSYQGPKVDAIHVPFSYLSLEVLPLKPGADIKAFRITAKTSLEVFCERSCAKFSLIDQELDSNLTISAIKSPELGNYSPSRLNESRDIEAKVSTIKKFILKDLGTEGHELTLEDAMTEQFANFYALFAEIKGSPAVGGEPSAYSISFDGKLMDATFKDPGLAGQVVASPGKTLLGFATGSIIKKETKERGPYQEFEIRTFDPSIVED